MSRVDREGWAGRGERRETIAGVGVIDPDRAGCVRADWRALLGCSGILGEGEGSVGSAFRTIRSKAGPKGVATCISHQMTLVWELRPEVSPSLLARQLTISVCEKQRCAHDRSTIGSMAWAARQGEGPRVSSEWPGGRGGADLPS